MTQNWTMLAASAIGSAHVRDGVPNQDYCLVREFGNGWGVAVVCDGAGSHSYSHIGSRFICWEAIQVFTELVITEGWMLQNNLPTDAEWECLSRNGFNRIRLKLQFLSECEGVPFRSLSSTLIITVFSPVGLCSAHIGDGRAGFKGKNGDWKPLMVPHEGEHVGETIFLTSDQTRGNGSHLVMNGVKVPESRVIREKPVAFVLCSDGCEFHAFECNVKESGSEKYVDPNVAHPGFFNPLIETIKKYTGDDKTLQQSWEQFLTKGTTGLANERDDKTMILAILSENEN